MQEMLKYVMLKEKGGGSVVKKCYGKLLAMLLVLAVLLSGCVLLDMEQLQQILGGSQVTPFAQMQYDRPDVEELERQMQRCCTVAQSEKKVDPLIEEIWVFFNQFNSFQTNYNLASIYYFKDMTDTYWEDEYNYCLERTSRANAALDELYYALAACPLREELEENEAFGEGFFDAYEGESIWDDTFTDLMDQQTQLESEYYTLISQAQEVGIRSQAYYETYHPKLAQLYVEMIALRQEIASYAGYEDYQTFAYDFGHHRDYTPDEAEAYLEEIGQQLVGLYKQANCLPLRDDWALSCEESQTYAYVEEAAKAMGGTMQSAFKLMTSAGLYDITYSEKKYDASFEVYLPSYYAPYVFVNPAGTIRDQLTFAHEFGHFCNDFATGGMMPGVDVAEVFSQGLEYLSLCYVENADKLEQLAMLDCMNIFVEQAAYALFEHRVYDLEGEELTVQNVQALYEKTCKDFGFDIWVWDSRDFVLMTHFFVAPMYIVSYVVSNDAAFQIYQLEKEEKGKGLALYEQELTTQMSSFMAFVEEAKLESPFAEGRIEKVRQTFEKILIA